MLKQQRQTSKGGIGAPNKPIPAPTEQKRITATESKSTTTSVPTPPDTEPQQQPVNIWDKKNGYDATGAWITNGFAPGYDPRGTMHAGKTDGFDCFMYSCTCKKGEAKVWITKGGHAATNPATGLADMRWSCVYLCENAADKFKKMGVKLNPYSVVPLPPERVLLWQNYAYPTNPETLPRGRCGFIGCNEVATVYNEVLGPTTKMLRRRVNMCNTHSTKYPRIAQ
jgi:hypothetical protein